jgi:hypothetical protein
MKIAKRIAVNDSKFAMWRMAIVLSHSDHGLSNSEINLIHEYWENFDFSEPQMAQLEDDFRTPPAFDTVWPLITDKLDRAHLINFALVLFNVDGDFSYMEQVLWEKINRLHAQTIDIKKAMAEARQATQDFLTEERAKLDEEFAKEPFLRKALHFLTFYSERW